MRVVVEHFFLRLLPIFVAAACIAVSADAQTRVTVKPPSIPMPPFAGVPSPYAQDTFELAIPVERNVNISLCVKDGRAKVNGWNRGELRVFADKGQKFDLKVMQRNADTGLASWVMVVARPKISGAAVNECLEGDDIEVDVPTGASVNLKGSDISVQIDGIGKAHVRTLGGDIIARNISGGLTASAGQGDIVADRISGPMNLLNTTGNIIIVSSGPTGPGDDLKASTTSGSITMKDTIYRQLEATSISGAISFVGGIPENASYNINTNRGSIGLSLPSASGFRLAATYGFGTLNSEMPLNVLTENIESGPIRKIVGDIGPGGGATVRLSTNSGRISLKKM
ncbi:MAG: hypothetical protein IPM50_02210 [Acidobacteriota bacterium]|nr:MAG: hypothetical protein IPM50_02210 [Acidobacteriota bacterium]